ncbi:MAG: 23S rRNA (guanosine(2251)-2'-O)-methyltransferase RlmB [Gammaproteobacteria bacterium]
MSDHQNLIHGIHAVLAALRLHGNAVQEVWVDGARRDARLTQVTDATRLAKIKLHTVTQRELDELAPSARHQGAIARCKAVPVYTEGDLVALVENLEEPPFLLVLDGVQDPHNLGACLRSADAAGVHGVVVPRDRAAPITAVVHKVASGAVEAVPFFQVTNLARTLRDLQTAGVWLVGMAGEAQNTLYEADLRGPLAVVLGGEGDGLRRLTREHCDSLARIPMAGTVESLNVSVAAGICLFEAVRQRGLAK